MQPSDKTILVTGATGHQGGAVARHLLPDGWHVKALVRDPAAPACRALADMGVELFKGDLLDEQSVEEAAYGVYGVYSVQSLAAGFDAEMQAALNLADAAKEAGVEHFVYSSVIGADREAGMPWVTSKFHIENQLRAMGLPLTIWRPVSFMDNFLGQKDSVLAGTLSGPEPADKARYLIAVEDIGRFVALSFLEPEKWMGKATEIAGDHLSGNQMAAAFSMAFGIPVAYHQTAPMPGMPEPIPDESGMPPREPDIAALREAIPDLRTLLDWASEQMRLQHG